MTALVLALALNVAVLVPVIVGMARHAPGVEHAYGSPSPSRSIVVSVHVAMLGTSVVLIAASPTVLDTGRAITTLLVVQIVYKATAVIIERDLTNRVMAANAVVATVHAVALTVHARA